MRLRLVMLGKTQRPEIRAMVEDYAKRISRYSPIELVELRETRSRSEKIQCRSVVHGCPAG